MADDNQKRYNTLMIKVLIMDCDGTLTDGKIYMSESGELFKAFDIKDGYGIHNILPKYGIIPVIITGRSSKILENRCAELGITQLYQNVSDKIYAANEILAELGYTFSECAYIGDDLNDLEIMKKCGLSGCPADSVKEIRDTADYVCDLNGGNGAVREFIEYIVGRDIIEIG